MQTKNIPKIHLFRFHTSDQGTQGTSIIPNNSFTCYTLELPWRNNQPNISCIPDGEYIIKPYRSRKYKHVYQVHNVPNRSYILIHSGNYAGDKSKGYRTHVQGCIIVGKVFGYLHNQLAVLNSRITLHSLLDVLDGEKYILDIKSIGFTLTL
jgi:hypothetical protein